MVLGVPNARARNQWATARIDGPPHTQLPTCLHRQRTAPSFSSPRKKRANSAIAKDKAQADKVNELLIEVAKRANSDAEPGTKTYRVTRSADEGLTFVVFEEYESAAALEAHQAGDKYQALVPVASELQTFDFKFFNQVYP